MKKSLLTLSAIFLFSVSVLCQYYTVATAKETDAQNRAKFLMKHMPDVLVCMKWQSQEEFTKRFNTPTRIISDESPCKVLE